MTTPEKLAFYSLTARTLGRFKVAHVLELSGDLWCLDLDFHASSDADLDVQLQQRTAGMNMATVLPGVLVPGPWERFSLAPMNRRLLVPCHSMKGGVLVAIRKES